MRSDQAEPQPVRMLVDFELCVPIHWYLYPWPAWRQIAGTNEKPRPAAVWTTERMSPSTRLRMSGQETSCPAGRSSSVCLD